MSTPPNGPHGDIDRRIQALAERHEALTQSLELVARIMQDNERQFNERFQKTEKQLDRILGVVEKLANVAQSHER